MEEVKGTIEVSLKKWKEIENEIEELKKASQKKHTITVYSGWHNSKYRIYTDSDIVKELTEENIKYKEAIKELEDYQKNKESVKGKIIGKFKSMSFLSLFKWWVANKI